MVGRCWRKPLPCILLIGASLLAAARDEEWKKHKECGAKDEVHDDEGACCIETMISEKGRKRICLEEPTAMSFAVAVTLIGSFTFLISLQYFTNNKDEEMKKYSWKVISSTISIFCAVMLFQSFDGVIEHWILMPYTNGEWQEFAVDISHMVIWYTITQVVLFVASGASKSREVRERLLEPYLTSKEDLRRVKDTVQENCMSYGIVCAHLTGFASINAWTGLQRCYPFDSSAWAALLPLVLCFFAQEFLQRVTSICRQERGTGWFQMMWNRQCQVAEDDVLGLTLSVVSVNSIRLAINGMVPEGVGCLPDQHQREVGQTCEDFDEYHRTQKQMFLLFGVGFVFVVALFFVKLFQEKFFPEDEEAEDKGNQFRVSNRTADRMSETLVIVLGMAFSWCTFFFNKQLLNDLGHRYLGGETATIGLFLALEVTYLAFGCMFLLNRLVELPDKYTPPAVDHSIVAVINAMGVWVGFAWESTFEEGVDNLSEKTRKFGGRDAPATARFVMGIIISIFVFRTWRRFQIPFIVKQGWKFNYVTSGPDLKVALQKLDEEEPELHVMEEWGALVSQFSFETGDYKAHLKDDLKQLKRKNNAIIRAIKEQKEAKQKVDDCRDNVDDMRLSMKTLEESLASVAPHTRFF
mmetsp:Transcript_132409/g.240864  ORF Transcript_132409/g.240864 Transcript_132409/m.240864 type:complete len:637 (-) Transcript_132409:48-1958(-)